MLSQRNNSSMPKTVDLAPVTVQDKCAKVCSYHVRVVIKKMKIFLLFFQSGALKVIL